MNEASNNGENDESDEEVDVVVKPLPKKKILQILEMLWRAIHHRGANFLNLQHEYELYFRFN